MASSQSASTFRNFPSAPLNFELKSCSPSSEHRNIECGCTATRIRAEKGAGIFARSVSPDTHVQGTFAGKSFEVKGIISGCVLIKRGPFDDCDDTDSPFAEGDTLMVFSGGKAVDLIVSNGGELIVSSGGTAESPIICDGGLLVVHSGGTALDVRKEEGAKTEINNGAVVTAAASPRSSRKQSF